MNNLIKKDINQRLKITQGHLKKVAEMNENGVYCIDILHQLQAIRAALGKIESKILENHLKTCVRKSFSRPNSVDKAVKEVLSIFEKVR